MVVFKMFLAVYDLGDFVVLRSEDITLIPICFDIGCGWDVPVVVG